MSNKKWYIPYFSDNNTWGIMEADEGDEDGFPSFAEAKAVLLVHIETELDKYMTALRSARLLTIKNVEK